MKLKIFLKGLIVVEKRKLGVDPVFPYHGQIFEFCGPKTHDANNMERTERVPGAIGK